MIDRALEKDRARASAEYLAQFRTDIEGFVALEVVEACVGAYHELGPRSDADLSRASSIRPAASRTR